VRNPLFARGHLGIAYIDDYVKVARHSGTRLKMPSQEHATMCRTRSNTLCVCHVYSRFPRPWRGTARRPAAILSASSRRPCSRAGWRLSVRVITITTRALRRLAGQGREARLVSIGTNGTRPRRSFNRARTVFNVIHAYANTARRLYRVYRPPATPPDDVYYFVCASVCVIVLFFFSSFFFSSRPIPNRRYRSTRFTCQVRR